MDGDRNPTRELHDVQARKKAKKKGKKKKRGQEALARCHQEVEQGPGELQDTEAAATKLGQKVIAGLSYSQIVARLCVPAGAGTVTHVRQTALYSDCPRPRREQASLLVKLPVKEQTNKVCNREFDALTVGQSPPTLDSTDRSTEPMGAGTATCVGQSVLYTNRPRRSKRRRGRIPSQDKLPSTEPMGAETATHVRQSVLYSDRLRRSDRRRGRLASSDKLPVVVMPANDVDRDVPNSPPGYPFNLDDKHMEEQMRKFKEDYLGMTHYVAVAARATGDEAKAAQVGADEILARQTKCIGKPDDYYIGQETDCIGDSSVTAPEQDQAILPGEQDQPILPGEQERKVSKDEIAQNGKKWMNEEAMVAFNKYKEGSKCLKGFECQFDELLFQCFNVEDYSKTYHHFNFTVKMRAPGSDDWTSQLYFAEVKQISRQKYYFCSLLEEGEDDDCYACTNRGMDELRHPAIGGGVVFDIGDENTAFPYYCEPWHTDEEFSYSREPGEESDDDGIW